MFCTCRDIPPHLFSIATIWPHRCTGSSEKDKKGRSRFALVNLFYFSLIFGSILWLSLISDLQRNLYILRLVSSLDCHHLLYCQCTWRQRLNDWHKSINPLSCSKTMKNGIYPCRQNHSCNIKQYFCRLSLQRMGITSRWMAVYILRHQSLAILICLLKTRQLILFLSFL